MTKKPTINTLLALICIACSFSLVLSGKLYEIREKEEQIEAELSIEEVELEEEIEIELDALEEKIQAYLEKNEIDTDDIAYCITDLESGVEISLHKYEDNVAASTYKLPLAMYYYEKVNAGDLDLDDALPLYSRWPLEELLYNTIVYSNNDTAEVLYENLGGYGSFKTAITCFSDEKEYSTEYFNENVLSCAYMQDVLSYLYENQSDFEELMEYLQIAQPKTYLNYTIQVDAYQKYGSYAGHENSVGLVLSCDSPYSIAIYTYALADSQQTIGDINEICYKYFENLRS
jgi:hypothetical protein